MQVEKKGWLKGLEPSTLGITIRCSNQLSYSHRVTEPKMWVFDVIPVPVCHRTALSAVDHNTAGRNGKFGPRANNQPKPPVYRLKRLTEWTTLNKSGWFGKPTNAKNTLDCFPETGAADDLVG